MADRMVSSYSNFHNFKQCAMIRFSKAPYSKYPDTAFVCNPDITYEFGLDDDDILTYYRELFRHRTRFNKPYIDSYTSIEDLEKDISGTCRYLWVTKSFREVYKQLDKQLLLSKINDMIAKYGNMIVIKDRAICIKTDEDIKPYDYVKNLCPNKEVLSLDTLERIYELGLWEIT